MEKLALIIIKKFGLWTCPKFFKGLSNYGQNLELFNREISYMKCYPGDNELKVNH